MKAEAVSQWWSQTKRLLAALPRGLPTLAPLRSLLVDFGVILVMIVLFVSIVLQVADPAPVADPISVPKSLADVGYSAEVVTTRLIDRSRAIEQANNAGIDRTSAAAATTGDANLLSTVTVPSAGVSLAVVVAGHRAAEPAHRRLYCHRQRRRRWLPHDGAGQRSRRPPRVYWQGQRID
jgi:hypothetical protein